MAALAFDAQGDLVHETKDFDVEKPQALAPKAAPKRRVLLKNWLDWIEFHRDHLLLKEFASDTNYPIISAAFDVPTSATPTMRYPLDDINGDPSAPFGGESKYTSFPWAVGDQQQPSPTKKTVQWEATLEVAQAWLKMEEAHKLKIAQNFEIFFPPNITNTIKTRCAKYGEDPVKAVLEEMQFQSRVSFPKDGKPGPITIKALAFVNNNGRWPFHVEKFRGANLPIVRLSNTNPEKPAWRGVFRNHEGSVDIEWGWYSFDKASLRVTPTVIATRVLLHSIRDSAFSQGGAEDETAVVEVSSEFDMEESPQARAEASKKRKEQASQKEGNGAPSKAAKHS